MQRRTHRSSEHFRTVMLILPLILFGVGIAYSDGIKNDQTYMPVVPEQDFEGMMKMDQENKPKLQSRQQELLESRYDLSDKPSDVMMSAGRKAVQEGYVVLSACAQRD